MQLGAKGTLGVLAAVLVLAAGCQKLNVEKTVQLEPGDVKAIEVDGPKRDQKVTVTISSPGSAVNVYVVLAKDQQAAQKSLLDFKAPANALASKEKMQDGTLEATVPAKEDFAVMFSGASKSTEVKLKVTGR